MATKNSNVSIVHWLLALIIVSPMSISFNLPYNLPYTTIVEKSVAGYKATDTTSFTIPDNQCSGFIDESLLCGVGGVAGSVRVVVREGTSFPSVRVNRHLRNISIHRGQDVWGACVGQAEVDLYVGCLVAPVRSQRRRRFIRTLPPTTDDLILID